MAKQNFQPTLLKYLINQHIRMISVNILELNLHIFQICYKKKFKPEKIRWYHYLPVLIWCGSKNNNL